MIAGIAFAAGMDRQRGDAVADLPVALHGAAQSDDLAGKMQAEIRCADQNTPVYVADPHVGFATVNTLGRNSAVE